MAFSGISRVSPFFRSDSGSGGLIWDDGLDQAL